MNIGNGPIYKLGDMLDGHICDGQFADRLIAEPHESDDLDFIF